MASNTGWRNLAAIRVLLVGDGPYMDTNPGRFGVSFPTDGEGNYIQDLSDNTFTVSEFICLLTTAVRSISVNTAHRRDDPNAFFPNFNFATTTELSGYDLLWIIGYEGYNAGYYGSAIGDDEIQAIAQFMDGGGGVFATGDHEGMGSYICGQIPRVRSMRKWFGQLADVQAAGVPQMAVDYLGVPVPAVNWPGGTSGRADTLQQNPSDSAAVFQFDDQSDDIPQTLSFPGGQVHPILSGGQRPISRFPDHMHEGEVVTPLDTGQVLTINGQQFTEYPAAGTGSRPVPSIIATGQIVGGHQTSIVGSSCENANFHSDTTSTAGRGLGILCVYDGRSAGVGRVVTDSSFHHYLDINLIGDPCGASPDRQQGFGPGYAPPAAGSVLADLQAFYVNTAEWLSRQKFQFSSVPPYGIGKNQVTATLSGSTPGVLINAFSVAVTGFSAADLGIKPSDLSGTPGVVPEFTSSVAGLAVTATGLQAEDPSLPATPQQFRWECAADFDPSLSAFAGVTAASPVPVTITASLAGLRAYAEVDLVLDRQSGPPHTG
jgi:hypothetical protein